MTRAQDLTLRNLASFIREHGYPPTVRQLASMECLASASGTHYRLKVLEQLGMITRKPLAARTLMLTTKGWNYLSQERVVVGGSS